ncbi:MAG: flagellar hook-basal body complex protein FliE [Novosphingobium sp.]
MTSPVNFGANAGGIQQIMQMRQQLIDKSQVLQQLHAPETVQAPAQGSGPAGGFADALKSALDGVNSTQQNADNVTAAYERGEVTDVAKVMLARQEAGVAFEATLQVRNRLLSAYQDIMRMGV